MSSKDGQEFATRANEVGIPNSVSSLAFYFSTTAEWPSCVAPAVKAVLHFLHKSGRFAWQTRAVE
jgi:hypothetical protein